MSFSLISYLFLFALISWRRFDWGLFFIFLLLPAYLIRFDIGPIPSTVLEAMVWIIFIIWIIKTYKHTNIQTYKLIFQKNPSLFTAIFLFLLSATVSVFTSLNLKSALGEWKAYYIEPIVLFLVLISSLKTKTQINNILFALILSGLATSILAIYQNYTGWYVPWEYWENRNTFRVTGWYGFPNGVGLFLAPLIPLSLYLITTHKHTNTQTHKHFISYLPSLISILFIISAPLAIFFAKSTGGLVGAAAGIIFLTFFSKKTRWPTIIITLIAFVALLGTDKLAPIRQELFFQDRSGQIRLEMWGETIEFLTDRPFTGAGLASYQTLIYPYRIDKWIEVFHHPHNLFLTMWVNLGLFGLIGFVWILVRFYRVGFQNLPSIYPPSLLVPQSRMVRGTNRGAGELPLYLLASMTALLTTGLVDSPYIKNDLAIFFWILPALLIFAAGQKEKNIVD